MIEENKVSKYLLYAIGEIVLVVIGILIALSINNWNNDRLMGYKEINILREMDRNLKSNVNQFSIEIENQDSIIQDIDIIMSQLKNNISHHDSLGIKYASIAWTEEFSVTKSAFETLKTIGFDLISSDSLREKIIYLYNVRYFRMSAVVSKVSSTDYTILSNVYLRHFE